MATTGGEKIISRCCAVQPNQRFSFFCVKVLVLSTLSTLSMLSTQVVLPMLPSCTPQRVTLSILPLRMLPFPRHEPFPSLWLCSSRMRCSPFLSSPFPVCGSWLGTGIGAGASAGASASLSTAESTYDSTAVHCSGRHKKIKEF